MHEENKGVVYLIGAGPGDPGLITVKGLSILNRCDAVVYDNLIPSELIVTLPSNVEKYYVGKKAGDHFRTQDEINQLMVELAGEGKIVARLKGSDPLIFGRGGEEARYLREHNIDFEIVPGVTSGIAAPAYCGIPCTDRELASFVLFVTGHKAMDKEVSSVPWEWVANAKGGTIVIYMGVSEFEKIAAKLIESGMPSSTPAAVIERGTFPSQRCLTSTLSDLPVKIKEQNISPPALFILGEVIKLQPWLDWFRNRPLLGIRVMVTRASEQAGKFYEDLRGLGAEVLPYPSIAIEENIDNAAWDIFKDIKTDKNNWLVFTSENGVRYFMKQFLERFGDMRKLSCFSIAVIGEGTSRELGKHSLMADFIPENATVNELADEMKEKLDLSDATIIRIRGTMSNNIIENLIGGMGAEIIPLTVYSTYYPKWAGGLKEKLFDYPPNAIVFTSGSTVEGLSENLSSDEIKSIVLNADIFSIGPSTTAVLNDAGINVSAEAKPHNLKALADLLIDFYKAKQTGRTK